MRTAYVHNTTQSYSYEGGGAGGEWLPAWEKVVLVSLTTTTQGYTGGTLVIIPYTHQAGGLGVVNSGNMGHIIFGY